MKSLLTIFFLLLLQYSFAQKSTKVTDSIQKLIKTASTDSLKVEHQVALAFFVSKFNATQAKDNLNKALNILESNNYMFKNKLSKKAEIYDVYGIIERRSANYDKALNYYLKSLKIKETSGDSINIGRSYHNIAVLFNVQKKYLKAEDYMRKAMGFRLQFNDSIKYAKSVNLYGYIKYKQKETDSALLYYAIAKKLFNTNIRVADVNRKIAFIHNDNHQYDKALHIFKENLAIFSKNNLIERQGNTLIELAATYRILKQNQLANDCLIRAEKIATQIDDKRLLYKTYQNRYKIAQNTGNHKEAFQYYKKYKEVKDIVFNIQKAENLKELELNYIYEKEKLTDSLNYAAREQQLLTTTNAQKKQTKLYSILLIISLLALISVVFLYRNKKRLNEEFKQKELLKFELLNSKLENISNYTEQLEVDNKMRFQFKEELLNKIKTIKNHSTINDLKTYQSLIVDLQAQISTEKRLDTINEKTNTKNSKLENTLSHLFPSLTKSEREICNLISLNLSNKEIMNIRNASLDSIKSARYRIRKKIKVPKGMELELFIQDMLI